MAALRRKRFNIANLAFFLEVYKDGSTPDERDSDLGRILWQNKGEVHYDRENGGSFRNFEQEGFNPVLFLRFVKNIIESVYRMNEERNFSPFVIVGFNDITQTQNEDRTAIEIRVAHRLLSDIRTFRTLRAEI